MNRILAIFKRELAAYFRSPIGYVLFAIYMAIGGLYFAFSVMQSFGSMVYEIGFLQSFLFIVIPILTMRVFSEERKNGTEVLLYTSPASTFEIVISKYAASLAMFLSMTAGTLIHMLLLLGFGGHIGIDTLGAYIAFIFLGASFIAIGVFASALTENQIIAAVISLIILFALTLMDAISNIVGDGIASLLSKIDVFNWFSDTQIDGVGSAITAGLNWINPNTRLDNYINGIFELSPIIFFVSLIAVFLFLTTRIIEKRRWSQR